MNITVGKKWIFTDLRNRTQPVISGLEGRTRVTHELKEKV